MYETNEITDFFPLVLKYDRQFMTHKMLHADNFYSLWDFQKKRFSQNNVWGS
jgi:hypothetical protein